MTGPRDINAELRAFLNARLREIVVSDTATATKKSDARLRQRWYATVVDQAAYASDAVYQHLVKDTKRWRRHPDFREDWIA